MAKKTLKKIPKTAALAKKAGYVPAPGTPSKAAMQSWVMVKQAGNWGFQKATTARASGSHWVCYYDPGTKTWTDCHYVP